MFIVFKTEQNDGRVMTQTMVGTYDERDHAVIALNDELLTLQEEIAWQCDDKEQSDECLDANLVVEEGEYFYYYDDDGLFAMECRIFDTEEC